MSVGEGRDEANREGRREGIGREKREKEETIKER